MLCVMTWRVCSGVVWHCQRPSHWARASVMASSGQALMHRPQASQASGLTSNACCHLCAKPLSLPLMLRADRMSLGKESTLKSPTGHTRTHSPLPSHRLRSITGTKVPASCLHSVGSAERSATVDSGSMIRPINLRVDGCNRLLRG